MEELNDIFGEQFEHFATPLPAVGWEVGEEEPELASCLQPIPFPSDAFANTPASVVSGLPPTSGCGFGSINNNNNEFRFKEEDDEEEEDAGADEFEYEADAECGFDGSSLGSSSPSLGHAQLQRQDDTDLQGRAAQFASVATALALEAYVRANTPPSSPQQHALPCTPPPQQHLPVAGNSGSLLQLALRNASVQRGQGAPTNHDSGDQGGSDHFQRRVDSPHQVPLSPHHQQQHQQQQQQQESPHPHPRGKGKGRQPRRATPKGGRARASKQSANGPDKGAGANPNKRKRATFGEQAVDDEHHPSYQCRGYNRKKRARCQNPALMDYIGPRPEYCAEHIDLDPKAVYRKCGIRSGEFNKPCKEVVLNEFYRCHKHFDDVLQSDLAGAGALERTKAKRARAQEICRQVEKEAEVARIQGERCLYQRKMKLLPKYRSLVEILTTHRDALAAVAHGS